MAAADTFALLKPWNWLRPFTKVVAADTLKSDTVDLQSSADATCIAQQPSGFSISVAGAVKVDLWSGVTVVFPTGALSIGTVYSMRVKRIWTTGTTATGAMLWFP